jgi:DNA-binding XRE family transcriptional regulator
MTIKDVLKRNAEKYREDLKVYVFDFPTYFRKALPDIPKCQGQSPTLDRAESLVEEWFKLAIPYPNYPLSEGTKTQLAQELREASESRSGTTIKSLRIECGLTESKLADEMGFEDDKTVRRHEKGEGMHPDTRRKYNATFERLLGRPINL